MLRWQEVPGAVAYAVEVSKTRDFKEVVFSTETGETELKWVPPSEDASYFFRVAGIGRSGARGVFSVARETGPIVSVPRWSTSDPERRLVWRDRAPVLTLSWQASERAVAYEVEVVAQGGTRLEKTSRTAFDYRPSQLGPAEIRVRAISETGRATAFSEAVRVVAALGAPTLDHPVDGARIAGKDEPVARLRWSAGPARAFEVQLARDASFEPELERLAASEPEITWRVPEFGAYAWRVRAFSADGTPSPWSTAARFTHLPALDAPTLLAPPPEEAIALARPDTIELRWTEAQNGGAALRLAYEVAVAPGPELESTTTFVVDEARLDLPVGEAGELFWRVRAVTDGMPISGWSESNRFEVRPGYSITTIEREPGDEGYDIVIEARAADGEPVPGLDLLVQTTRGRLGEVREATPGEYRARWTTASGKYDGSAVITVRGPLGVEVRHRFGASDWLIPLEPLWVGAKVGARNDLAPAVAVRLQLDAMYHSDAVIPNSFVAASFGVGFDGRDEGAAFRSSLRRFPLEVMGGLRWDFAPIAAYAGGGLVLEPYRGVVRTDGFPDQRQRGLLAGVGLRAGGELDVRYGRLFAELGYSFVSPVEELLTLGGNSITLSVGLRVAPFAP